MNFLRRQKVYREDSKVWLQQSIFFSDSLMPLSLLGSSQSSVTRPAVLMPQVHSLLPSDPDRNLETCMAARSLWRSVLVAALAPVCCRDKGDAEDAAFCQVDATTGAPRAWAATATGSSRATEPSVPGAVPRPDCLCCSLKLPFRNLPPAPHVPQLLMEHTGTELMIIRSPAGQHRVLDDFEPYLHGACDFPANCAALPARSLGSTKSWQRTQPASQPKMLKWYPMPWDVLLSSHTWGLPRGCCCSGTGEALLKLTASSCCERMLIMHLGYCQWIIL